MGQHKISRGFITYQFTRRPGETGYWLSVSTLSSREKDSSCPVCVRPPPHVMELCLMAHNQYSQMSMERKSTVYTQYCIQNPLVTRTYYITQGNLFSPLPLWGKKSWKE